MFSSTYLLEYLKSYAWGATIVLSVNILVFPRTSERELRKTIVTSLEHLATFAALIGKAYNLKGTQEDSDARELLSQTIKADFTFLAQKIEETSIEINWSKYSMHGELVLFGNSNAEFRLSDYQRFTDRIRMLQRNLIAAHISLLRLDKKDVETFRQEILPCTRLSFTRLRRDIDLTIREIGDSLGCGPMFIEATQSGYLECLDQQRAVAQAGQRSQSLRRGSSGRTNLSTLSEHPEEQSRRCHTGDSIAENLFKVSKRLQLELGTETPAQTRPGTPTQVNTAAGGSTAIGTAGSNAQEKGSPISSNFPLSSNTAPISDPRPPKKKYGPTMIKAHFGEFETAQKDVLIGILTSTDPGQETDLKIYEPGPSVSELYGGDFLRGDMEQGDLPEPAAKRHKASKKDRPMSTFFSRLRHKAKGDEETPSNKAVDENDDDGNESDSEDDRDAHVEPTPQAKRNETLVRIYSLLFAWEYVSLFLLSVLKLTNFGPTVALSKGFPNFTIKFLKDEHISYIAISMKI